MYRAEEIAGIYRIPSVYRIPRLPDYIFSVYKGRERGCVKVSKKEVLGIVVLVLSSVLVVAKAVYDSDKMLEDSKEAE